LEPSIIADTTRQTREHWQLAKFKFPAKMVNWKDCSWGTNWQAR